MKTKTTKTNKKTTKKEEIKRTFEIIEEYFDDFDDEEDGGCEMSYNLFETTNNSNELIEIFSSREEAIEYVHDEYGKNVKIL